MGDYSSFASGFKTGFGSAFLQFTLERFATFGSFAWREIGVIWGVEEELRKLQRTFLKIQDLVDHMDGSPLRFFGGSNAWQMWFEDLRKLAYDADALLDHVSLHLSNYCRNRSVNANQENKVFSMVLSSFTEMNLPIRISEMQNKLEELFKEIESLLMIEKAKRGSGKITSTNMLSNVYRMTSFAGAYNVVGRIQDQAFLLGWLRQDYNDSVVIPIVGMGGLGKTTLARLVYNDELVLTMFDTRIWVSITIDFDVVRIMKSIIEHQTLHACNLSDLDSLQLLFQSVIGRKTLLLVLDDYWSENYDDWESLCSLFRFSQRCIKVIVTTRSTKVSSIVSSSPPYRLMTLSDDDCWSLVQQRASTNMEANPSLEPIGRQIAMKCKGLPLVAVALGRLLHCRSSEEEWRLILETELWDMPKDKNIFLSLMLSYLHLPPHLQKCFAYCSIFPKNHEFEVEELVLLWIAEGFIQPSGAKRLEDIGNDCFNDLYYRSFFQKCQNTPDYIIYKMHEVIHDMARLVSRDVCFQMKESMSKYFPLFGNACHLSLIHDSIEPPELQASQKNERLRTFLVMRNNIATGGEVHCQLFLHLQFLRVLGLSRLGLIMLPDSVDQLEYLRYLNLSENPIVDLPPSMCKLVALQTLKLRNCPGLLELPKDMWNLSNLRHLDLDIKGQLHSMPIYFGRLTSLQTLSAYIVGRKEGHHIAELKDMDCLRGSLCIKNLECVSNAADAAEAKLAMKVSLDKLELRWSKLENRLGPQLLNQRRAVQGEVFEELKPHENLKELVINNYWGNTYPNWLGGSSCKFTSIHLKGLKYCDNLPLLGQLPFLKFFAISDMPLLEYVDGHEFYGMGNEVKFPSLESFELGDMPKLIEWRNVRNSDMPCLISFTINDCENLTSLPPRLLSIWPNSSISNCPSLPLPP